MRALLGVLLLRYVHALAGVSTSKGRAGRRIVIALPRRASRSCSRVPSTAPGTRCGSAPPQPPRCEANATRPQACRRSEKTRSSRRSSRTTRSGSRNKCAPARTSQTRSRYGSSTRVQMLRSSTRVQILRRFLDARRGGEISRARASTRVEPLSGRGGPRTVMCVQVVERSQCSVLRRVCGFIVYRSRSVRAEQRTC